MTAVVGQSRQIAARVLSLKFRALADAFATSDRDVTITGRAAGIQMTQLPREVGELIVDAVQRGFLSEIPKLRELVDWAVNDGPDLWEFGPTYVRCATNVFYSVKGANRIRCRNVTGKAIQSGTPVLLGRDVLLESDPEGGLLADAFPSVFTKQPFLRHSMSAAPEEQASFQALLRRAELERSQLTCLTLAEILDAEGKRDMQSDESPRNARAERRATLVSQVQLQKSLMIAVATGGPRIQEKNSEYEQRRQSIRTMLSEFGMADPNPYSDLWGWYGKWSDGSLPTYQSRRQYVSDLYQPLLDGLARPASVSTPTEPTGWARVDRGIDGIRKQLETATNAEEFQTIGLLSREVLISLAQAVFDRSKHLSGDGVQPSETDANRMLEAYIATELGGGANEVLRKHAKAALTLAVELQHKRTAEFREAALCAEATQSVVNLIAIVAGRRDP